MDRTPADLETFHRAYWRAMTGLDYVRLRHWERFGLTMPQLRVLFYLRRSPGTTTRGLSRALGIGMPTVSELVQKLVEAGLVARGQHPADRRQIPLVLTDAGDELAGMARAASLAFAEQIVAQLGDDLPDVSAALEKLSGAVDRALEALEPALLGRAASAG